MIYSLKTDTLCSLWLLCSSLLYLSSVSLQLFEFNGIDDSRTNSIHPSILSIYFFLKVRLLITDLFSISSVSPLVSINSSIHLYYWNSNMPHVLIYWNAFKSSLHASFTQECEWSRFVQYWPYCSICWSWLCTMRVTRRMRTKHPIRRITSHLPSGRFTVINNN